MNNRRKSFMIAAGAATGAMAAATVIGAGPANAQEVPEAPAPGVRKAARRVRAALEPERALIGFAGPRVIQQTIRQNLPEGFQRAEFLLEHGMVDDVIDRREHRTYLGSLLGVLTHREAST